MKQSAFPHARASRQGIDLVVVVILLLGGVHPSHRQGAEQVAAGGADRQEGEVGSAAPQRKVIVSPSTFTDSSFDK